VGREFNGAADGIDQPAENYFERGPASIAFEHLFHRRWLLSGGGVGVVQRPKDIIKGTKEDATYAA
jgi:hypothetical protein